MEQDFENKFLSFSDGMYSSLHGIRFRLWLCTPRGTRRQEAQDRQEIGCEMGHGG